MDNELIELRRQIAEAKKALAAAEKRYAKAKAKAEAARKKKQAEAARKKAAQARKEQKAAQPKPKIIKMNFGFEIPTIKGNVNPRKLAEKFVEKNELQLSLSSNFSNTTKTEKIEAIEATIMDYRQEHEAYGKTVYGRTPRQALSYALEHTTTIATPEQVGNRAFIMSLKATPAVDVNNKIINYVAYDEFVENYLVRPDGTTEEINENNFKKEGKVISYTRNDGTKVYFELRHGSKFSTGFYIYDEDEWIF